MSLLGECLGRALNRADKTASAQDGSVDYLGESREVSGLSLHGEMSSGTEQRRRFPAGPGGFWEEVVLTPSVVGVDSRILRLTAHTGCVEGT